MAVFCVSGVCVCVYVRVCVVFVSLVLVVSGSGIDCLERLVSEMNIYVSSRLVLKCVSVDCGLYYQKSPKNCVLQRDIRTNWRTHQVVPMQNIFHLTRGRGFALGPFGGFIPRPPL